MLYQEIQPITKYKECICFLKSGFWKITFQIFLYLFAFKKVDQRKTLPGQLKTLFSQRKIWFGL